MQIVSIVIVIDRSLVRVFAWVQIAGRFAHSKELVPNELYLAIRPLSPHPARLSYSIVLNHRNSSGGREMVRSIDTTCFAIRRPHGNTLFRMGIHISRPCTWCDGLLGCRAAMIAIVEF